LSSKFLTLSREGGRALLIVDEAQDLTPKALEELRLLTNLQQDGQPLLQIFLLGQSELRDLVHSAGMEQVHQRIVAASHLQALKENETRAYVEHRLSVVGWRNDPAISTAVYPVIFKFSEGVPRRINLICSRLFLHASVERRHQISVADAKTVVAELQEEQLSTRNLLNDEMFFAPDSFDDPLPVEAPAKRPAKRKAERAPEPAPKPAPAPEPEPEIREAPKAKEAEETAAVVDRELSPLENQASSALIESPFINGTVILMSLAAIAAVVFVTFFIV